ncbi:MAG: lysophospholipid acyltransferase family protein [Pseudomonadota bacterium]
MKKNLKKILKSTLTQNILAHLGYGYLWFVFKTTRWSYIGVEHIDSAIENKRPFIAAFWHGRLAMTPFLWRWKSPFYMLLSEHSDGLFIAKIVRHQNIRSIYGSRTRNGARAAIACVKELKTGSCIGITPDGPKGPRHEIAEGLIHIARLANAPIIPISYALTHSRFLKTWDRFLIPLPFGKGVYVIGSSICISQNKDTATIEESKALLKQALLNVELQADHVLDIKN